MLLDVDARIAEMTVRSLDVDARIVEWHRRMAFEKYRVSQLEKCVTRHIVNILKSRIWRWYDQKEATLKADGEKYRVSQLEECVKRHAIGEGQAGTVDAAAAEDMVDAANAATAEDMVDAAADVDAIEDISAVEPKETGDSNISGSRLCPFAAAFTPEAREGCTKKLRQEVSKLTGIPFSTGYFQCLERLVAAIRLMGRNVVVVVETKNICPITGFHTPIRLTTGTVHEVRRCTRHAHGARLYWRTSTATVEVVTIMKSAMERAEQGERTSVIYVDGARKTPSHYEEFQGKLSSAEVSTMIGGAYLIGQYKTGQAMDERELIQEYRLQPVMADEGTKNEDEEVEVARDLEEREEREAFYSGESEGEESIQTVEQPTVDEEKEEPQGIDLQEVKADVESCKQAWDDMCQEFIAVNTKTVKKVAATWSNMDGASKLVQIVTSHHTRREVAEEVTESDLVMVVGEKF